MIVQSNVYRRRQIDRAKTKGEGYVAKAIVPVFESRLKAIKRDLRKGNLRHRLKKNDGLLYKQDDPNSPAAWNAWNKLFRETLRKSLEPGAEFLQAAEDGYFLSHGFEITRIQAGEVLSDYMLRGDTRISNIGMDTEAAVNRTIADWFNTDAGLPELISQLERWFSPARASNIAATETAYVASQVSLKQMQHFGIEYWQWDAFKDATTCELCMSLMEESKQKPFTLSDPMPPDPSHPRCRCGIYYVGVDVIV